MSGWASDRWGTDYCALLSEIGLTEKFRQQYRPAVACCVDSLITFSMYKHPRAANRSLSRFKGTWSWISSWETGKLSCMVMCVKVHFILFSKALSWFCSNVVGEMIEVRGRNLLCKSSLSFEKIHDQLSIFYKRFLEINAHKEFMTEDMTQHSHPIFLKCGRQNGYYFKITVQWFQKQHGRFCF